MPVNEWTFTARVKSWIDEILRDHPEIGFSKAEVEQRGTGIRKRRDLTIFDRDGNPVLTGELKMPENAEGRSPFHEVVVRDAHEKADDRGVGFYFTCNVNKCVLWQTFELNKPITDRHKAVWDVLPAPIYHSDELEHPRVQDQFKVFLLEFLTRAQGFITGEEALPVQSLDESFLQIWEAALQQPVSHALRAISDLYLKDKDFTANLDKWMVAQQWIVSHRDEDVIRENTERAAKFSCYMVANRIIFYKALRRRIPGMRALKVPPAVTTGAQLQKLLGDSFKHAVQMSRDYETVFTQDYGDGLPFLSDRAVSSWRALVKETDGFDFTQIDYEVIGQIFERMLSTQERHKFGQHYTRSEVVDLINAFCIRDADAKVLDPACGGGTFLVRAYKRKSDLSGGNLQHQDLLKQLFGLDISPYPAHLTTVNLATRDLIDDANYPLVARKDFFDATADKVIFHVPVGSTGGQVQALDIPKVDAVVGNPPYVRQEKITEYYGKRYKDKLRKQVGRDMPGAELTGRSDIHCYFFTHASSFLREGGYMGLLTSSTWLDTTYGFALQKFLLDNFEIIAVFESNCEPWFTGARVTTAATILRRQSDPNKRGANRVKFVSLTKPLSELFTYSQEDGDQRMSFDSLRDYVESAEGAEEFAATFDGRDPISVRQTELNGMRVRIVKQSELYQLGCLPFSLNQEDESSAEDGNGDEVGKSNNVEMAEMSNATEYTGYKWGIFLRAPDVFFDILRLSGNRFVPLASPDVASVRRGITTGCDRFFFVKDCSAEALSRYPEAAKFKKEYGISARQSQQIRIVQAGDGSVHLIERQFLEPVVFNPMELHSVVVRPTDLTKSVLIVSAPRDQIKNTHVLRYIKWGEREGFDDGSTCRSRERWYELPVPDRGDVLWSMTQRYRHLAPLNPSHSISNKRLFNIRAHGDVSPRTLCAILNSTLMALNRVCFGRLQGGDPVIETEVVDAKMMLVPDPRLASESVRKRLEAALDSMSPRKIGHLVAVDSTDEGPTGELAYEDRQELDDAVLELLGISDPKVRQELRAELYAEMTKLYRSIRRSEKRMQGFRSANARRGKVTPRSIADEIWEALPEKPEALTLLDFAVDAPAEDVVIPEGKSKVIADLFDPGTLQNGKRMIELGNESRAQFAKALSDARIHGSVRIPTDPEVCKRALDEYENHRQELSDLFLERASAFTADEGTQEKIVKELWRLAENIE